MCRTMTRSRKEIEDPQGEKESGKKGLGAVGGRVGRSSEGLPLWNMGVSPHSLFLSLVGHGYIFSTKGRRVCTEGNSPDEMQI